jgi:hypothetical protein
MAIAENTLPYGLRDLKFFPLDQVTGVYSAGVDLPVAQTLSFSESEDYEELRGDDKVVAIRGKGPKVEWDLEAGGISLAAYAVLSGATYDLTGTTPNAIETVLKTVNDARPYVRIEGQSISDSGGDFHCTLFRARASSNLEGTQADGTFWITKCSGEAIGDIHEDRIDYLYEFTHNETATAIDDAAEV